MKIKAGVIWGIDQEWEVEDIEVDPPKAGEVLVEWKVAGHVPQRRAPRHRRHGADARDA